MLARVSGPVLHVDRRTGISKAREGQDPRAYSITTVRVLVEETGLAEVTIPDAELPPSKGEYVDYLVEFSTYSGRVQSRLVQHMNHAELSVAK